jgi:hypothetical protein
MQRWLTVYSGGHFADEEPPTPESGVLELDATFERVWRVWLTVVRQSKRFGSDREELNRRWHSEMRNQRNQSEREGHQERWPLGMLAGMDSDHWTASLAQGAYAKAEEISALSEPKRTEEADALNKKLTDLFGSLQVIEMEGESLQRVLQDFLNLPAWQRRHELYSAWISTQILNALRDQNVENPQR